jgi:hypothetical protein
MCARAGRRRRARRRSHQASRASLRRRRGRVRECPLPPKPRKGCVRFARTVTNGGRLVTTHSSKSTDLQGDPCPVWALRPAAAHTPVHTRAEAQPARKGRRARARQPQPQPRPARRVARGASVVRTREGADRFLAARVGDGQAGAGLGRAAARPHQFSGSCRSPPTVDRTAKGDPFGRSLGGRPSIGCGTLLIPRQVRCRATAVRPGLGGTGPVSPPLSPQAPRRATMKWISGSSFSVSRLADDAQVRSSGPV